MKILSVTYLNLDHDPRAKKFADTLAQSNELTVLDLGNSKKRDEYNIISSPKHKNPIFSLFSFWLKTLIVAKRIKPDVIIAHNYYNVFPVWLVSKLLNALGIYDSYELYVPSKRQKLSIRSYFFYLLEKMSISHYPIIFSANKERSRLMKAKFKLKKLPIDILNISNSVTISDISIDNLYSEYPDLKGFLDSGKIIVYQGYMSTGRDIDRYLQILAALPDNFKLLYLGDGPDLTLIRNQITKSKMYNRALALGRVKMQHIVPLIRHCHYGIATYHFRDYNNRYCSPNKIFEYSLAHLPFISSRQTTIANIMKDVDYVCYIDIERIEDSAKAIIKFDKEYVKDDSVFDDFNKTYNWDIEKSKILTTFENIGK